MDKSRKLFTLKTIYRRYNGMPVVQYAGDKWGLSDPIFLTRYCYMRADFSTTLMLSTSIAVDGLGHFNQNRILDDSVEVIRGLVFTNKGDLCREDEVLAFSEEARWALILPKSKWAGERLEKVKNVERGLK